MVQGNSFILQMAQVLDLVHEGHAPMVTGEEVSI